METKDRKQVRASGAGINLTEVKEKIPELESLCNRKIEAAADFDAALTICALKTGIIKGVL